MRTPPFLLTTTAQIARHEGEGAFGTITDPTPETVRCRFATKRRQITDTQGSLVISEAEAEFAPDVNDIPLGSEVIVDGTTYNVVRSEKPRGPGGHIAGVKVLLTQGG